MFWFTLKVFAILPTLTYCYTQENNECPLDKMLINSTKEQVLSLLNNAVIPAEGYDQCPPVDAAINSAKEKVRSLLSNRVMLARNGQPPCTCKDIGKWRKIAHLNMNDSSQ